MNTNPSRSPRSQRLLALTVITGLVALFGAVVVADGFARLLLGGVALVLSYDVFRELRSPGALEKSPEFDQPAGPWLVGMLVFVVLNVVGFGLIRDRTRDDLVVFVLYGLSFAISYSMGQIVCLAILRLPRYRVAARQP